MCSIQANIITSCFSFKVNIPLNGCDSRPNTQIEIPFIFIVEGRKEFWYLI